VSGSPLSCQGPASAVERPSKRGEAARQSILEAALRLFTRKGIVATSIDDIIAEAGIARMTVYNHFQSKDRLVLEALEYEGLKWRRWFFAALARSTGSPRDRLLSVFDIVRTWFEQEDYFGCSFMNALLEQRMQNDAVLAATKLHKQPFFDQIEALAEASGARDPAEVAYQINLLVNGAIVNAVIERDVPAATSAKAIATSLLDAACTSGAPVDA
jgi:AcrR family transcriptional regulator